MYANAGVRRALRMSDTYGSCAIASRMEKELKIGMDVARQSLWIL